VRPVTERPVARSPKVAHVTGATSLVVAHGHRDLLTIIGRSGPRTAVIGGLVRHDRQAALRGGCTLARAFAGSFARLRRDTPRHASRPCIRTVSDGAPTLVDWLICTVCEKMSGYAPGAA
jgi:hypothetical protein